MPRCKMIINRKKYVFCSYVGTSKTFFGRIWCKIKAVYWNWRLDRMSEGEIINRYYSLTDRKDEMSLCLKDI
jgi:hypothetical protein